MGGRGGSSGIGLGPVGTSSPNGEMKNSLSIMALLQILTSLIEQKVTNEAMMLMEKAIILQATHK